MSVRDDIAKDMKVVVASIIESNVLRNMNGEVIQRLPSLEIAKDILSHPSIAILSEDQTWPEEPNKEYHSPDYSRGYERGQLESESANFKRMEK